MIFNPPLRFAKPLIPEFSEISDLMQTGWKNGIITKGKLVELYEKKISTYLNVENAFAVSSCTIGLVLALQALKLEGDCLLPSFTFTSTAQALLWNNLTPVFTDCHPTRYTATIEDLNAALTKNTSCVVIPYIFGNPPPLKEIQTFCEKKKVAFILDAAHAFGSLYHGRQPGSFGNMEVFSTSATKLLCTGEGGVITTKDRSLAEKISLLREYGHNQDYEVLSKGLNGRITEFQAAMGISGLPLLEKHALRRNELAMKYTETLKDLPLLFQEIEPGCRSSYKDFSVLLGEDWGLYRDETMNELEKVGIATRRYFYPPLHQQKYFSGSTKFNLPNTEKISNRIISLPIFYDLKEAEIEKIGEAFHGLKVSA